MAPYVPGGVSDGQWHSVQLHYYNKVRNASSQVASVFSSLLFQKTFSILTTKTKDPGSKLGEKSLCLNLIFFFLFWCAIHNTGVIVCLARVED